MTPTERAKRSDALYYETVSVTRRVLCDMIANREADLEDTREDNAKLLEQMERLVTLLRVDCDIDASWDGLRRFWSIGLTEDGCLMRDRACKAEAENAKLRELVRDMWREGMCECGSRGKCASCEYDYPTRMRELGVEVDE